MRHRKTMGCLLLCLVAGCASTHGGDITASPANWAEYDGKTVTVRGNAGNSRQGAIVRLEDNGYIPLKTRERWGIDAVGRPVVVTGKIVTGRGFREEAWVIEVISSQVLPPDQSGQSGTSSGL